MTLGDTQLEEVINNAIAYDPQALYDAIAYLSTSAQSSLTEGQAPTDEIYLYQGSEVNNPLDKNGKLSNLMGGYNREEDEFYFNTEAIPINDGSAIVMTIFTEAQRRDNALNRQDLSDLEQTELAYFVGDVSYFSWSLFSDPPKQNYTYQDALDWNIRYEDYELFKEGNRVLSRINPEDVDSLPFVAALLVAAGYVADALDVYDAYKEGGVEEASKVFVEKLVESINPVNKVKKVVKLFKRGSDFIALGFHAGKSADDVANSVLKLAKRNKDKIRVVSAGDIDKLSDKEGVYVIIAEAKKNENKIGEIYYVGQSKNIRKRVMSHKEGKSHLSQSIKGEFKDNDVEYEIVAVMEIPLDGSDKFSRELVESGVLEQVRQNEVFKTYIELNRKNPVTDNTLTPRGMVKEKFKPGFNKEYKEKMDSSLKELKKVGNKGRKRWRKRRR